MLGSMQARPLDLLFLDWNQPKSEANGADDDLDDVVEVKRLSAKDGLEARDSPFAANNNFGGGFGVPSSPVPPALQRAVSKL